MGLSFSIYLGSVGLSLAVLAAALRYGWFQRGFKAFRYELCCKDQLMLKHCTARPYLECRNCFAQYPVHMSLCRPQTVLAQTMDNTQAMERQHRLPQEWLSYRDIVKPKPRLIRGRRVSKKVSR